MIIDLRSDTVTKPVPGMMKAMMAAEVGDDVFGEDPAVNKLEEKAAAMFGMEAGLFCPSGTMTNQIAIKLHTQPFTEIICDRTSHIYNYEVGAAAVLSGISFRLTDGLLGKLSPKDVTDNINPDNVHHPDTVMVEIENTSNRGGGSYYTLAEMTAIAQVCRAHHLRYHLDGARIFNMLAETGTPPAELGKLFDTISICLSKGLGAPVGSVLLTSKDHIRQARRIRKAIGGGMRQAGILAAAGIYALDNHIGRLKEDHRRARLIGETLSTLPVVETVLPVSTNIVIFRLGDQVKATDFISLLKNHHILASITGPQTIRMVTHLDLTDEMMKVLTDVLKKIGAGNTVAA